MTQATQPPKPAQASKAIAELDALQKRDAAQKMEYVPFLAEAGVTVVLSPQIVIRYLCKPTRSGEVCTEDHAMRFMMLCKARGLNPWEGDAYIVGYDTKDGPEFNLITAHQALLKRAEVHPEYDGMESGVIIGMGEAIAETQGDFVPAECVLLGGWCKIHFKNRKYPIYRRLNLEAFKKPFGVWNNNPAGMIVKCAEGDGLRSAFPNKCGGMYLEGEMMPSVEVTATNVTPARMNIRAQAQMTPSTCHLPLIPLQRSTVPRELARHRRPISMRVVARLRARLEAHYPANPFKPPKQGGQSTPRQRRRPPRAGTRLRPAGPRHQRRPRCPLALPPRSLLAIPGRSRTVPTSTPRWTWPN